LRKLPARPAAARLRIEIEFFRVETLKNGQEAEQISRALERFRRVLTSAVRRNGVFALNIRMSSTTMKALRKMRPQRGAQLESIGVPAIGPTDVLVRVRAASICGTDLHIYGWDRWSASRIRPPLTFGHEFCGDVEKVGDEVATVRKGDF